MDLSVIACALLFVAGAANAGVAAPPSPPIVTSTAMKKSSASSITLHGETVTLDYIANPRASHGRFLMTNGGDADAVATLEAAWLETSAGRRDLSGVQVFDPSLPQKDDRPPDHRTVRIEAGASRSFDVSFDGVSYEPAFGETVAVGIRMRIGEQVLEAKSPLQYVRRWPLEAP